MTREERSNHVVGHARRQPLCHQRPEPSDQQCIVLRRRRHQFVRVVAVHHAIVLPAGGADEAQWNMRWSRGQVLERERELESLCYRHMASCDGLCRCSEPLEPHTTYDIVWHALPLELYKDSDEPLGSNAVYAVVAQVQRHTQPAATAAGLHSVLPALVYVVARAIGNRQVLDGIHQVFLDASGEFQEHGWKVQVSGQAVEESECGDFDCECIQTFEDGLAFAVALSAGAEDLRVARDGDRAVFGWSDGEEVFVDFDSELGWQVEEAEGSDRCWLVGIAQGAQDHAHGALLIRGVVYW